MGLLKIMGKVFIGFVIVIIIAILVFSYFTKTNSKHYGNNEKILKSDNVNAKKALVVYQPSRSKLTTKIAENIAKGINDSGYEVTINYPGEHLTKDISNYTIVVFGSPVYIGQTSSSLSDYMKSIKDFSASKILIFATGGQINNGELDKMEEKLGGKKAAEKLGFINGSKDENRAYEIGKKISGEN